MITDESIGDYDARNAAEAGRVCGEMATAKWHIRRGLKSTELDAACRDAFRAYHRVAGKLSNRARQRALSALKELYPWQYAQLLRKHRWDVELEAFASGEYLVMGRAANRARQRAMAELSRSGPSRWRDYQRLRAEIMEELLAAGEGDR